MTATGSTDLQFFASMDADDQRPVLKNFSGSWKVDSRRSASLEPLFASMSVGWLARKLVSSVSVDTHVYHTREAFITTDNSVLGSFQMTLVPDGRWRPVIQVDKNAAPVCCSLNRETGELKVETRFPNGLLTDKRVLISRTQYQQTLYFVPTDSDSVSTPPTHYIRYFNKVETEEERAAGEEAEEAAKIMLAHQAATLGLVSTSVSISLLTSPNCITMPPGSTPAGGTPNITPVSTPSAVENSGEPTTVCDFSGSWVLDRTRSDTLESMLVLMGLPWLARKIANSLEITVVQKHNVTAHSMNAEDHSSMGVTLNAYTFDGQPRHITSKDGKTSTVTASVVAVPLPPRVGSAEPWPTPPEPSLAHSYGCIRIVSILPDGAGETNDTRCMIESGRTMRQTLVYTKGGTGPDAGKQAVMVRYLTNKEFDAAKFAASVDAMHGLAAGADAPSAGAGADASPALSSPPLPATPDASAAAATGPDPFFISMSGTWSVDSSRSEPFDALWASMGVGWLTRKLVGIIDITTTIVHTKDTFRTEEKSSLGAHIQTVPFKKWGVVRQPDGKYLLMRARQVIGAGDLGATWLGDIGTVPPAWVRYANGSAEEETPGSHAEDTLTGEARDPSVPMRSLPVRVPLLTTAQVVVTTSLADVSSRREALTEQRLRHDEAVANGSVRSDAEDPLSPPPGAAGVLLVKYHMERRDELIATFTHMDAAGTELISIRRTMVRKEPAEQRTVAQVAESARLQHACTLLMARRAAADDLRALYMRRKEDSAHRQVIADCAGEVHRSSFAAPGGSFSAGTSEDDYELTDGVQCVII